MFISMIENNYENSVFISAYDRFNWISRDEKINTSKLKNISNRLNGYDCNLSLVRNAANVLGRLPLVIVDLNEKDVLGDLSVYSNASNRAMLDYLNDSLGFTNFNLRSNVQDLYEAIDDIDDPLKILFFPNISILDFKKGRVEKNIISKTQVDFTSQYLSYCIENNKISDGSLTDFEKIMLKSAVVNIGRELDIKR